MFRPVMLGAVVMAIVPVAMLGAMAVIASTIVILANEFIVTTAIAMILADGFIVTMAIAMILADRIVTMTGAVPTFPSIPSPCFCRHGYCCQKERQNGSYENLAS